MKIAVLFDGAGLARLGLEQAGHECVGFELNPVAHHFSKMVGAGNCELADVRSVDLDEFDAVWASPPCQWDSFARTQGDPISKYSDRLRDWSLSIQSDILWVENVMHPTPALNDWGICWNAAQFTEVPIQNRNRVIGGRYPTPHVYRPFKRAFDGVCPAVLATEYKGCASDTRRASRYYGRCLSMDEVAYRQGFQIPDGWRHVCLGLLQSEWDKEIYHALGNGVPVYMARAFGEAVKDLGLGGYLDELFNL